MKGIRHDLKGLAWALIPTVSMNTELADHFLIVGLFREVETKGTVTNDVAGSSQ
jgi:hypothetical protein